MKFDSKKYWEDRYESGRDSGAGSYGRLAEFKAEFLNNFCSEHDVKSVVEFGSGDGNQCKMFKFDRYIGLDVSTVIVKKCIEDFRDDKAKSFFAIDMDGYLDNLGVFKSDLSLSLDVIYHLVEDDVFKRYVELLFDGAEKYVIIYASNVENSETENTSPHVNHRKFTTYVEKEFSDWKLMDKVENKYPFQDDGENQSFADFYVYERKN